MKTVFPLTSRHFYQLSVSALLACLLLSGCSFPGVHKVQVQQGNKVTQAMVDTLKIGMSTEQVEYVLGSPLAVNPFDPKRWEYHYSVRLGADIKDRKHLVVVFDDNGQLRAIEGDYSAAAKPDVDTSAP